MSDYSKEYLEGVITGLKICKEMWAQGTISHENIYEHEVYYKELLKISGEKEILPKEIWNEEKTEKIKQLIMKEQLIQQHKTAKEEVFQMLGELKKIETHSLSPEQEKDLTEAIIKLEVEYEMRGVFINQLEDLE